MERVLFSVHFYLAVGCAPLRVSGRVTFLVYIAKTQTAFS
jgi:hypothetical protein